MNSFDKNKIKWDTEQPLKIKWDNIAPLESENIQWDDESGEEKAIKVIPSKKDKTLLSSFIKGTYEPYLNVGKLAAGAFYRGLGAFSSSLDLIANFVSEKTGLPKGGAFEAAKKYYMENAEYWDSKVKDAGLTEEIVGEFIGGAAPGMAEFMLGVPFAAIRGYAEGGPVESGKQAAKRALMGQILHAANTLKTPSRTVTMAGVGATEAMAEGASPRDIAKSAGIMAGFGLTAGKGKVGAREVARDILSLKKSKPQISPVPPKQSVKPKDEAEINLQDGQVERTLPGKEIIPTKQPLPPATKPLDIPEGARRSDIIKTVGERLDVPIRHGKFKEKAAGIYKNKAQVIRLKRPNDVEVAIHEVGHHIQNLLGFKDKMPEEVKQLAYEGAKNLNREGFAEFLRYYVTQEGVAKERAPEFYKEFEAALSKNPDIQDVLIKARGSWKEWEALPSTQKVMSFVQKGGGKEKRTTLNELYRQTVDELRPLQRVRKLAQERKGERLRPSEDLFLLAWLNRGWARKAEQYIKWSPFQLKKEGVVFQGKPLAKILKPIEKRGELELFDAYLISKRAVEDERILKGFDKILSKQDFGNTVKELEGKFQKAADELYEYSDNLLGYLVDSGRISQQRADRMRDKNVFYVPFYRVMDSESPLSGLSRQKYGDLFNPIKRLKGSSRDIYSPTESLLYNTYAIINVAERNRVGKAIADLTKIKGMGDVIEKIPFPVKPVQLTAKEALENIKKQLNSIPTEKAIDFEIMISQILGHQKAVKSIIDIMKSGKLETAEIALRKVGMTGDDIFTINDIMSFRQNIKTGPNEAIFYRNGKPELFELSPDLYKAIQSIDAESIGTLGKILAFPAKTLRAGATLSPEFMMRNPARDQLTAFIFSKYGFIPGWDLTKGLFHVLGKTEVYQEYNASGAAHAALVSLDRNYLSKNLKKMIGKHPIKNLVKHPLETLQILSEVSEETTRLGEFSRAIKKEGEGLDALLRSGQAARDVTLDFSRIGEKTKAINMITAFWNAQVQGVDKMVRAFKEHPGRTFTKAILGITLPSVLLYLAQKDDPYYQEIPEWRKTLFWNIVTHNEDGTLKRIWSIPKPFELGILFGSVPIKALEWYETKEPEGFKESARAFLTGLTPSMVPTAAVPVVEWFSNKSIFFDRPIVSRSKEVLDPILQTSGKTKESTKLIAQLMNKVPGLKEVASPDKIQNMIFGYTGGLGRLALESADDILKTFGAVDAPPEPSMTLSDVPGIRGFVGRFPSANAKSIETFYDRYLKAKRSWESTKEKLGIRGKGLPVEQPQMLKNYETSAKALSVLRKTADAIHNSRQIPSEEKRKALDNIYWSMINIARISLKKPPIQTKKELPKTLSSY